MNNQDRVDAFYGQYGEEDLDLLGSYLTKRIAEKKPKENQLGIVFDILRECDISCVGCGTKAVRIKGQHVSDPKPSLTDICKVLDKVKDYADTHNKHVFVNFGGGEPFLRDDILDVLAYACDLFGRNGVGVDSNASLDRSKELLKEASNYASYIGISVNGLQQYHDWWAGVGAGPFNKSFETARHLCQEAGLEDVVEVTSVATRRNLKDIPQLMRDLKEAGIKQYSVHRVMPVGRMEGLMDIVPDAKEYCDLLLEMVKTSKEIGLNAHIHHSIESIHASLLLGIGTYVQKTIGDPDASASIGIEPEGTVVFDPWCTTGVWEMLRGGNAFDESFSFDEEFEGGGSDLVRLTSQYATRDVRCNGCPINCSGGSRIAAAAQYLASFHGKRKGMSHVLSGLAEVDPACPLAQGGEMS